MKKLINQFSYLLSALPIIILLVGNVINGTHVIENATGFFEDYPALWLTGVGFIINAAIYKNYAYVINNGKLNMFNSKLMKAILLGIIVYLSWLINHQWVVSQLSNQVSTWSTIDGHISYPFVDLVEKFNGIGLFYYFTCIMFWMMVLVLAIYLVSSMLVYLYKIHKKETININNNQYLLYSGSIVLSYLIYYVSLQINDLILEGLSTFERHGNRMIMLVLSLFFILVYVIISGMVRSQNKHFSVKVNYEIMSDIFMITAPFAIITGVTIFFKQHLDYDTYLIYAIFSFAVLVITIIIIAINQFIKAKRLEKVSEVVTLNSNLNSYIDQIEKLYREMRSFKHDHNNIMLSINWFLKQNDLEGLKKFYEEELVKSSFNDPQYQLLNKLTLIDDPSLKGVLLSKLSLCEASDIELTIDIDGFEIDIEPLDLARIVGILIDNAIEAAVASDDKHIKIYLVQNEIVISNSYSGEINIVKGPTFGYSTKGSGRGIGLFSLKYILQNYPYQLKTSINQNYYTQTIEYFCSV